MDTNSVGKQDRRSPEELIVRIFLDLYQNGKQTMQSLTKKYGAEYKQMAKYIDHLSMVVPICEEQGKGGYTYFLMPDYKIGRAQE